MTSADITSYPSTIGADILMGGLSRADEKLQPARALALRAQFPATQEISLADDPHQGAVAANDGKAADLFDEHHPGRLSDRCGRIYADDWLAHYGFGLHVRSPEFSKPPAS
jgi:hypothetical protein